MERKKVYLLLTDTGTMFTRMVKLYTKKPYNHASIVFDENFNEVYSFGRKRPRNPFIGGFVNEDVRQGLFKNARCAIYSFDVSEIQINRMKSFIYKIEMEKHLYRYNLIGLITFIINKPYQRKHAFFCSEFVAQVLNEGGISQIHKPISLVSPNDLRNMKNLRLEFEGQLADLLENDASNQVYPIIY
ncbi:C40 family peptidase [Ureibacillus chungkukjangi]|uniref:Permuted papain-like amidase YaeF/Yiix C92 family enzyme n=1 Tax=Ureibacillus chungkukjangi TaxID=1202712 RepID=A0A318TPE8_9BACL|nr:hypothetical protein [Ureibacillus chungkukjangi]PYF06666.1 hypothetical protein BJ095_10887 [Ureibacillus chungkukjangi]